MNKCRIRYFIKEQKFATIIELDSNIPSNCIVNNGTLNNLPPYRSKWTSRTKIVNMRLEEECSYYEFEAKYSQYNKHITAIDLDLYAKHDIKLNLLKKQLTKADDIIIYERIRAQFLANAELNKTEMKECNTLYNSIKLLDDNDMKEIDQYLDEAINGVLNGTM